jgi:hypothetical protein
MTLTVCDSMMGAGKTQAAVNMINGDAGHNYIFITPYLAEADRIKAACADRAFKAPENYGEGKRGDLCRLLEKRENIVSTHSLFKDCDGGVIELIKKGSYKLILDEVFDVVEPIKISRHDLDNLLKFKLIAIDENKRVRWLKPGYRGAFSEFKKIVEGGNVMAHKGGRFCWVFPVEAFEAFDEVLILTYMFEAQIQKYYYDMYGIEYRKIYPVKTAGGEYIFSPEPSGKSEFSNLRDKIHIFNDSDKINEIGEPNNALSVSWFEKESKTGGGALLKRLKNNIGNVLKHYFKAPASKVMWTAFKNYESALTNKNIGKGFVSANLRATNKLRDKTHLAYCVNVFLNPNLKSFFWDRGVRVDDGAYALSEMVQWIWRSAIRDGSNIWIYIPSKRMREILTGWLNGF